jgi:hypothetical protein
MNTKDAVDDGGTNAGTNNPSPTPTPGITSAFTLLDMANSSTMFHKTILHVDVIHPASESSAYPIKAFLHEFLQHLQKIDMTNNLLPINETANGILPLTKDTDIPSGDDINKYVMAITNPNNAPNQRNMTTIHFYICINTMKVLWQLKCHTTFYSWLQTNHVYLCTHGFTTMYDVASAGFLGKMSPMMHWREMINNIIQEEAKAKGLSMEIRLINRMIPYGKGEEKTAMTAVKVQTDCLKVGLVREFMIELFETKRAAIPDPIFFVLTPANGTMTHEFYYNLLHLHHTYTHDLRSFAITNVRVLKATLAITVDEQGTMQQLSFLDGLKMAEKPDGTKLFISIEPTTWTEKEGRYLLIMTKDCLAAAQAWFDSSVKQIASNANDNMVRIT